MSTKTAITLMAHTNRCAALMSSSLSRSVQVNACALVQQTRLWRAYGSEKSAQKEAQSNKEGPIADAEVTKKLAQEVESLTKELQMLKEKNDELLDKYKRSLADSENLRVRLTKQIGDAKIFGIQNFCKDLLEVADTLGHATQAVPQDHLSRNQDLKNLFDGLTMTQASLLHVFKRHGLEPVNPLKEKFNPNMHEALFTKEDSSVEPNTIVEVTKLGYKLQERCIRPALVGVSKTS